MLRTFALFVLPALSGEDWTALPLPSMCIPRPASFHPVPLLNGSHLRMQEARGDADGEDALARLSVTQLAQMLEEDARAHGTHLELFRGTPGLLARGDAAAMSAARALLADLERAGDALQIELEVTIVAGPSEASSKAGGDANKNNERDANAKLAGAPGATTYRARVGSGEQAFFGARATQSFIAGFASEVATDSGVAEPVLGSTLSGTTLHLRAARIDGGRRVHLSGVFDVAAPPTFASFDPGTSDLGVVQEPRVAASQAIFAGVVESGAVLELTLAGAPLPESEWSVRVRASTRPDADPVEGDVQGWATFDLAFLAREAQSIPPCRPGAGLQQLARFGELQSDAASLPPSALAAAVESGRAAPAAGARSRAPLYWSNDLFFVPRAEAGLWREARNLVRGTESLRTRTGRVDVRMGRLHASLPVCEGFPARLLSGVEGSYLVDYRAELATQTWMPSPEMQTAFDGLVLEIASSATHAACSFWFADSETPVEVQRTDAHLGRLQLLRRSLRADSARIAVNQPERRLLEPASGPSARPDDAALVLRYTSP